MSHAPAPLGNALPVLFFKAILLDSLFLPYAPGLHVPFGVLLAPLWPLATWGRVNARYLVLCVILLFALLVSFSNFILTARGMAEHLSPNVIGAGIILYMAVLITMTTTTLTRQPDLILADRFLLNALKVYIFFKFCLALVFYASVQEYFELRAFWTVSGTAIEVNILSIVTRFTGTLSDPNNFACILTAALAFVIFRQPARLLQNIALLLMTTAAVVASMSVTGAISLLGVTVVYTCFARLPGSLMSRAILRGLFLVLIPICFWIAFAMFQDHAVVQLAIERISGSSADSRLEKFAIFLDAEKLLPALLIGEGAVIVWGDEVFLPHIGHIYLIFAYGLPAYLVFFVAFFPIFVGRVSTQTLFFVPIFLGFSVNVGIYEPRFASLWAILAGVFYIQMRMAQPQLSAGGSANRGMGFAPLASS